MTDTYLLPEVHIVITQTPGVDGTSNTARLAQIESDLATLLGRPIITHLQDIEDVTGTPVDGDTIIWDASDNEWVTGVPITGINVQRSGSLIASDVTTLNINASMNVSDSGGGAVAIFPVWGTTAESFARGNHTHTPRPNTRSLFGASGTLSGGTRTLTDGAVTGLNPANSYQVEAMLIADVRGEGTGAGYSQPRISLNGESHTRLGGLGEVRTVAGVDREFSMQHGGVTVSGVSSFSFSATISYQSGDPINIGAGELVIRLRSNR